MRAIWAVPIIASILILGFIGLSEDVHAVGGTISDQASCEAVGGIWIAPNTCQIQGTLQLENFETLTIDSGIVLDVTGFVRAAFVTAIDNHGTINNSGKFSLQQTTFNNFGTINNFGSPDPLQQPKIELNTALGAHAPFNNFGTVNNFGVFGGQPYL